MGNNKESARKKLSLRNSACYIYRKSSVFYSLIRIHAYAYLVVRNVTFSVNLAQVLHGWSLTVRNIDFFERNSDRK